MDTKSFFGENGLTSTSANHYCNLAKEAARTYHKILENIRFYTTSMKVIGDNNESIVSVGIDNIRLDSIRLYISRIAGLNSLIAFFREAIKEKQRLSDEASAYSDADAHTEYEARLDKLRSEEPKLEDCLTVEDVIKTWTVGEQEKYLSLEAEAAAYGKYIHEDGCLSKARIDMMDRIMNPTSVQANGRDTLIFDYSITVDDEDVNKLFFELQAKHRAVQAELNGMKKKIEDTIKADTQAKDAAYNEAFVAWKAKRDEMGRELQVLINKDNIKRAELRKEVEALKIVVPNRLQEIFDYLKTL